MKTNRRQSKILTLIDDGPPADSVHALMLVVLLFSSPDEFAVFFELAEAEGWMAAVELGQRLEFGRAYANQCLVSLTQARLVERTKSNSGYSYRLSEGGNVAYAAYDDVYSKRRKE